LNIAELTAILKERNLSLANAESDLEKKHIFEQILRIIIKPKHQGDRTAFRNLSNWIQAKINDGTYQSRSIYKIVVDFALEASGPHSRNPAAVFMSILKKELNYLKG
jgi:hypothetical protein